MSECLIWSLKQKVGDILVNLKCYAILLLRYTTMLLRFGTVLGNESWCSNHGALPIQLLEVCKVRLLVTVFLNRATAF